MVQQEMYFKYTSYPEFWWPFCSVEWNHLCNLWRRHNEEQFCKIIMNLDQLFMRRCRLKTILIKAPRLGSRNHPCLNHPSQYGKKWSVQIWVVNWNFQVVILVVAWEVPMLLTFRCWSLGFFEGGCSLMSVECAGVVCSWVVSAICSKGLFNSFDLFLFLISSVHFSQGCFNLKTLALTEILQGFS